jgi:hypothetical protein
MNLNKNKELTDKEAALIAIYTMIPPRRLEYRIMKLTHTLEDLDNTYNYLYINTRGTPKMLIFNEYKTASTFGIQQFPVPRNLATKLKTYIESSGLVNGNFLFGKTHTKPYVSFSSEVTGVFLKHTGKSISVNLLRHSYISSYLKRKHLSITDKTEIGAKMAHSITIQARYNRIDL